MKFYFTSVRKSYLLISLHNKIRIILDIDKPQRGRGDTNSHEWGTDERAEAMTGSDNAFDDVKRDGPIVYLIGKSASKKLNRRERGRGFTLRWSERDEKWRRWRTKGQREHNVSHSARSCIFYDMSSNLTSRMKHNSRELVRIRGKVGMSAYGLPARANLEPSKALQPNLPWCASVRAHRNH